MSKYCFVLPIICLAIGNPLIVHAADEATARVEVGKLNEAYVNAFNSRDIDAVAACFGKSADYTLLTGDSISGRPTVQAAHQSFFKNNPDAKVKGKQVTYRHVRPGVVLASGDWEVTGGPSEYPSCGKWFTVVVRQNGKWVYQAMRLLVPVSEP